MSDIKTPILATLLTLAFVFMCAAFAEAMSVQPTIIDMQTAGRTSKTSIQVVNDGKKKLPVEVVISKLRLDSDGKQTLTPAGDEFLIFPPQALVPPGATQNFRVQWVGEPDMPEAASYIFSVNQVPVKMKEDKAGVQLVFNFGVFVSVDPASGNATLKLINTDIGKDKKGKRHPALTLENSGNANAKLSDATVTITGNGWSQSLSPEELRQIIGVGLVQPGSQRRIVVPVELPDNVTQVTAQVKYQYKK